MGLKCALADTIHIYHHVYYCYSLSYDGVGDKIEFTLAATDELQLVHATLCVNIICIYNAVCLCVHAPACTWLHHPGNIPLAIALKVTSHSL